MTNQPTPIKIFRLARKTLWRGWLVLGLVYLSAIPAKAAAPASPLRIGRMATLTHAPALVAQQQKAFEKALGKGMPVQWKVFTAGPSVVEALFAGEIDLAYLGPSPIINAHARSGGQAVRLLAGAASGGAALVVQPHLLRLKGRQLTGKRFASVQVGNTQDIALRLWLKKQGINSSAVVRNFEGADLMAAFATGYLDGAWVVEPWVSRLTQQAGGKVRFEESSLWPDGRYPTTLLAAQAGWLVRHPRTAQKAVNTHVKTIRWMNRHPATAQTLVNRQLAQDTGKPLSPELLKTAWPRMVFTATPMIQAIQKNFEDAKSLGFLGRRPGTLRGLFALAFLQNTLKPLQPSRQRNQP